MVFLQPGPSPECWFELSGVLVCGPHTGIEAPGIATIHLTDMASVDGFWCKPAQVSKYRPQAAPWLLVSPRISFDTQVGL